VGGIMPDQHYQILKPMRQDSEYQLLQQDPKGGELCQDTAKSWETVMEAGSSTDVQIVCPSLV